MPDDTTQIGSKPIEIAWGMDGLVPGIIQDARTDQVRMLGHLNAEALRLTVETGLVHFYSRSRRRIWLKGETSGNTLRLVDIRSDCDGDALLLRVIPDGPTCHTGAESCFFGPPIAATEHVATGPAIITRVAEVIDRRFTDRLAGSYTTYLFEQGVDKIGKKIGEEAAEVIIAAKNDDPDALAGEAADLIYHLLVMLRARDLPLETVWAILDQRHATGGAE